MARVHVACNVAMHSHAIITHGNSLHRALRSVMDENLSLIASHSRAVRCDVRCAVACIGAHILIHFHGSCSAASPRKQGNEHRYMQRHPPRLHYQQRACAAFLTNVPSCAFLPFAVGQKSRNGHFILPKLVMS